MEKQQVIIFDSTLRDGEQAPGAAMTIGQKIDIAQSLEEMGVDVIEAGFAAASKSDAEAINRICKAVHKSTICSLSRCYEKDIRISAEALAPAIARGKGRIHVFVSTSDRHMRTKLKKTPQEVMEMTARCVAYARQFTKDVEWSAEDATRSDRDFLAKCVQTAVKAGATTINLPDTVGVMSGFQYHSFMKEIIEKANVPPSVIFSVHCHDDKGWATANSLFGIQAGARQIECCMNGLGERAGNAALEQVVMGIHTDQTEYPFYTNIDTTQIKQVSEKVACYSGFFVPHNRPVVGRVAFTHGSGIHQDGMVKALEGGEACIYGGISPEAAGYTEQIAITRHSGNNGVKYILQQQGIDPIPEVVKMVTDWVKEEGEHTKIISPAAVAEKYLKIAPLCRASHQATEYVQRKAVQEEVCDLSIANT